MSAHVSSVMSPSVACLTWCLVIGDVAVGGLPDLVLGDLDVVHEVRVAAGVVDGIPGECDCAPSRGGREAGRGRGFARGGGQRAFYQVERQCFTDVEIGEVRIRIVPRPIHRNHEPDPDRLPFLEIRGVRFGLDREGVREGIQRKTAHGRLPRRLPIRIGCIQRGEEIQRFRSFTERPPIFGEDLVPAIAEREFIRPILPCTIVRVPGDVC